MPQTGLGLHPDSPPAGAVGPTETLWNNEAALANLPIALLAR